MMTKTDAADLAIARALAAVRNQISNLEGLALTQSSGSLIADWNERAHVWREALAILEAAKMWEEVMSLANPSTDPVLAELESALMRAIRGGQ